jgi:hypothetical protein
VGGGRDPWPTLSKATAATQPLRLGLPLYAPYPGIARAARSAKWVDSGHFHRISAFGESCGQGEDEFMVGLPNKSGACYP